MRLVESMCLMRRNYELSTKEHVPLRGNTIDNTWKESLLAFVHEPISCPLDALRVAGVPQGLERTPRNGAICLGNLPSL